MDDINFIIHPLKVELVQARRSTTIGRCTHVIGVLLELIYL